MATITNQPQPVKTKNYYYSCIEHNFSLLCLFKFVSFPFLLLQTDLSAHERYTISINVSEKNAPFEAQRSHYQSSSFVLCLTRERFSTLSALLFVCARKEGDTPVLPTRFHAIPFINMLIVANWAPAWPQRKWHCICFGSGMSCDLF